MFPALFVSHGAPTLLLEPDPIALVLRNLASALPRPEAVLVISAHWQAEQPCIGNKYSPQTLHDFCGFPESLYQLRYDCHGAMELGESLAEALGLSTDQERDLDHGTWVVLKMMYPDACIPVLHMPVCPGKGLKWALEFSRHLLNFRDKVLIIGSGGLVHNLSTLDWSKRAGTPESWALTFADQVKQYIDSGNIEALIEPQTLPYGKRAVPSLEHYQPLLYCLGATNGEKATLCYESWHYHTLSMQVYAFGKMTSREK